MFEYTVGTPITVKTEPTKLKLFPEVRKSSFTFSAILQRGETCFEYTVAIFSKGKLVFHNVG